MFKFAGYYSGEINPAHVVSINYVEAKRYDNSLEHYPNGVVVRFLLFFTRWLPPGYYAITPGGEYWRKGNKEQYERIDPPHLKIMMADGENHCLNFYGTEGPQPYSWDYGIRYNTNEEMYADAERLKKAIDSLKQVCQYKP